MTDHTRAEAKFIRSVELVCQRATMHALQFIHAGDALRAWAAAEQAKVSDPRARSYSIVAQYFDLGKEIAS